MDNKEKLFLRIKNFKSLKDIEVEIKPLTFLFGANGAGKSSFLQAIKFVSKNLFSIWVDTNEGGPDSEKYYYKVDDSTDLISFFEIITNNNLQDQIEFNITIKNSNLNFNNVFNALDFLKSKVKPDDEIAPYFEEIVYDELLPKQVLNLEDGSIRDSDKKRKQRKYSVGNLNIDFSVEVIFKYLENFNSPNLNLKITDLTNDISYSFIPNSMIEDNYNTYYKNVKSVDNLIEQILNSVLQFDDNIPFVNTRGSYYFENIAASPQALSYFYDRVNNYFIKNKNFINTLSKETKINIIQQLLRFYILFFFLIPNKLKSELSNFVHLTSVRERPRPIYILREGRFLSDDYYGLLRAYDKDDNSLGVPIFVEHFDFSDALKLIENVQGVPVNSIPNFINYFLKELELADSIELDKDRFSGFLKYKSFNSNTFSNLANASSGLLQILPIISTSIFVPRLDKVSTNYIRLIEQPELHLHPKLQTMLAEFFCHKALRNRTFIIETHSEHFIRKIQVLIAHSDKQKSHHDLKDRVGVYYFHKDKETGQTSVKKMEMEDNGFFKEPWPDGFFDDSYNLARELIYARKN